MGLNRAYKDIQLPQLRSFCIAATERSFTVAAKVLGLSVPAVWQQVRSLERALGATLLRRNKSGVEITLEGQLLLQIVQPHVSGLDSLARLFESQRAALPRKLNVVSTHGLIAYHLPGPVQEFTEKFPGILLKLHADIRPSEVIRLLERGEADLGLLAYDRTESRSAYLQYENLFEMQFYLLTSTRHPLARKKRVTMEDIVQHPLVVEPEGSLPCKMLDQFLRRDDLAGRVHIVTESTTMDIIRRYVALGVGISLLHMDDKIVESLPDLH